MAIFIVENSGKVSYGIKRYICKTMEDIPVEVDGEEIAPGSRIYVSDEKKTYILNTAGQWVEIDEGSGGASALSDLTDVDISGSVQGGKVLKYNAVEEKWAPGDDSGNVQSDWNESDPTSGAFILNKPTIPAAQVQADWDESDSSDPSYIQNKPTISQDTWRPVSVDGNLTLTNVAGGDIINLIVQGTCAWRTFINNSGRTTSSRNWSATPYISVTPNKLYKLIGINNGKYGETNPQHAFYNENHEFISCVPSTTYDITPPDNTAYIRLSIRSEEPDTNVIKFYRVHGNLNLISGDHISINGDYGDVEISYNGPAIPTPTASDIDKVIKVESDGQGGAQYTLGAPGSSGVELTQAEYDALTPEEKTNGTEYFITDGTNAPIEAANILYDNEDSGLLASDVQNAIDELNYNMSNLEIDLEDLRNIDISNIQDGQIIKYDASTQTWVNADDEGGTELPVPTTADIGKVIEVVSDGEGGAEYSLISKPDPVVYIGTLGTGGTAESLPTVGPENNGWEYKVITAGTYAGKTAKVGDMFISNGIIWDLIPSGDEKEPIQLSDTLIAGQTSITFQDARITGTSCIDVYAEAWYTGFTQSDGEATLTFPAQSTDMLVQIMVAN